MNKKDFNQTGLSLLKERAYGNSLNDHADECQVVSYSTDRADSDTLFTPPPLFASSIDLNLAYNILPSSPNYAQDEFVDLKGSNYLSDTTNHNCHASNHTVNSSIGDNEIKAYLKSIFDPQIYKAYLTPLHLSIRDELLHIEAPSRFLLMQLERSYLIRIKAYLKEKLDLPNLEVKLDISQDIASAAVDVDSHRQINTVAITTIKGSSSKIATTPIQESIYPTTERKSSSTNQKIANDISQDVQNDNLNPRYVFENFVVGNSNQFCHAAAQRVAENPGGSYNPLFIYGGVGLGKTHLLHAIGNRLKENGFHRIAYHSSETFTNDLIKALRSGSMNQFKERVRSLDLLLIDDIQFIAQKERTQEEFFHTFNALYGAKKQIILTADKPPSQIPGIEERLKTRFGWGLSADIQAPDYETRVAILNRKSVEELGKDLPDDIASFIAENINTNVRELEGALTRVIATIKLNNQKLTLSTVKESLSDAVKKRAITIHDIKAAVCKYYDLTFDAIESKSRARKLSFPRHMAMYLARVHTTASYTEIGNKFGKREHTTVINSSNVVKKKLKKDLEVQRIIKEIESILEHNS